MYTVDVHVTILKHHAECRERSKKHKIHDKNDVF
jgi:hypothetical protein